MKAVPIPDGYAEALGGRRRVIGEPGDPTRTDVRPCEYVVVRSDLYPGRPAVLALVELDDDDRVLAAAGARLWLRLDGGELPWSLAFDRKLVDVPTQQQRAEAIGLVVWGSECTDCGNTTHGSQHCDSCGSTEHTTPLFISAAAIEAE